MGNASTGENFQEVTVIPVATSGPCVHACHAIIPFMILLFVMSLTVSITQMPLLMIVLRSVSEEERAFALGMQFVIFRLFGYIPSPIMFGSVIDSTCLLWRAHCSSRGFCLMYDIEKFRVRYVGVCSGIKVVAAVLFALDWCLIRRRCLWDSECTVTVGHIGNSVISIEKLDCVHDCENLPTRDGVGDNREDTNNECGSCESCCSVRVSDSGCNPMTALESSL